MILRCLSCFASNAYSCFSKVALTTMAVLKVLVTIAIIAVVAVKLEDVRVVFNIPDLTTPDGLQSLRESLGLGTAVAPVVPPSPLASPPASTDPNSDIQAETDLYSVNASCLLQKKGQSENFDKYSRTMCSYVYAVCGISLLATFVMACLLWCTCQLCGAGPVVELSFAVLGTIWWLTAVLVLQENTAVAVDTRLAVHDVIFGKAAPPPPFDAAALMPPPSPPPPPLTNSTQSKLDMLYAQVQEYAPKSLGQWRQALIGMSWAMMGMFAASGVLLLVEACGCVLDCCASMCRCCCCPDRPEARWRANLRKRKRLGSDEYVEMCGGVQSSSGGSLSSSGGAPAVMVVARSDDFSSTTSSASLPKASPRRGFCG